MRKTGFTLLQFFLISSLLFSCSPEKQEGSQAPSSSYGKPGSVSSLEIQPSEATRETTFYIGSKDLDLSKAKIQWFINGKPAEGSKGNQFRPSAIRKGDIIQAKAEINNLIVESNQIKVKNIPPTISKAEIIPRLPKANDILKINASGNDRDGDKVTFTHEWFKNSEPSGNGETLKGPFKRDDKISVHIKPFDGDDYGQPIILITNIYNSPPELSAGGIEKFENNVYTYQVIATDPDGDTLVYFLKRAPRGMTIDKTKGFVSWQITEKDAGRQPVSVQVSDGHGGEVLYNFDVTVGFEVSK
ncbi:MAG: putative Ig domain-containing protein [Nitrospirota bacterium]